LILRCSRGPFNVCADANGFLCSRTHKNPYISADIVDTQAQSTYFVAASTSTPFARGWVMSLQTTNVYAEVDLEMKTKALKCMDTDGGNRVQKSWHKKPGLLEFLKNI
jgi:hypothetical protein